MKTNQTMNTPQVMMRAALIFAILLGLDQAPLEAVIGLSTRFVDVTLEYIEVGKSYNLRQLKNVPYTVKNKGDGPIDIKVDVLIPKKDELVAGYEPVPDPTWIQIVPNKFNVPGGQTAYAEMILQVVADSRTVAVHFDPK